MRWMSLPTNENFATNSYLIFYKILTNIKYAKEEKQKKKSDSMLI